MQLAENEVKGLCLKARDIFLSQPILLELEAPLKICGRFRPLEVLAGRRVAGMNAGVWEG